MYKGTLAPDRQQHCLAVAHKMRLVGQHCLDQGIIVSSKDDEAWLNDLFLLGYLHDIGYAFCADVQDHSYVGGELLKDNHYKYWEEVFCHGHPDFKFHSLELDLLNYCDMTTNSTGQPVTMDGRLQDIATRHGIHSSAYKEACRLRDYLTSNVPDSIWQLQYAAV